MPSAYDALLEHLARVDALDRAAGRLRWDQETYMPPGGARARAAELATLSALSHERFTADEVGDLLAQAEAEEEDPVRQALLRETRWAYDRQTQVPGKLVEEISQATSEAFQAWTQAKAEDDWPSFQGHLARLVELKQRYAAAIDPSGDPYEVLFQDYEPWLDLTASRATLQELRDGLVPLVEQAPDGQAGAELSGPWPLPAQRALAQRVLDLLGYDRDRGRLDESPHPFTSGNVYDVRITTRLDEEDLVTGLTSTIHEFGHAAYTQGLPTDHFGTPLCEGRDLVVHESQSRFWENHVGRSLPFWRVLTPLIDQAFPDRTGALDPERAWRAANQVAPTLIRVDSDELTYHLHIVLRMEIEQALIHGELEASDVPGAWNERMQAYLGIEVPSDREGCLQDVHWAHGAFGYFPTYSLGSLLAAQLAGAYEEEKGSLAATIEAGGFEEVGSWMGERIHQHGKRYTTPELIERATGAPLSPEAFLGYARTKFEQVWERA
ncbi:MAG: carboxypeptidase M32 [Candidatus Thermoplasmatota archaeon]|nr:carboxypeptidase M32 [Candidatus Thermoplasmatota archaeon]